MDIDKGYVPEEISQPQTSEKMWPPLIIGLFPYVPRIGQFQRVIAGHWGRRHPNIPLEFRPFNCYKEDPPLNMHIFGLDNIFLARYVRRGWVKSWKPEEIQDVSGFFPFARRSCIINNTFYAVPYLGCINTIMYRRENVLLRNAVGPQGILSALGICPNPHQIWPAPNQGLLLSFAKPTTTALYYLLACNAIKNTYPPFPPLPVLGTLDEETLKALEIYTKIAGHAQVNYVDPGNDRITHFINGRHQGLVGVTELACYLPLDQLSNYALRLFPYSTRSGEQAQPYVDSLVINNSISNPEHIALCRELINLIANEEVQMECQLGEPEHPTPQFLVPTRRATLERLIKLFAWYEQILHVLPLGENIVPCVLDENSSTWLNGDVPPVIRGKIAGPQSPGEQQKIAALSGDPSLPANLVEKW